MSALELHAHRWFAPAEPGAPTLVLLHGTGGDENDLVPRGRMLLPGAGLLGVRGNVSEQGAPRFFRRLAEGVFDLADLATRTAELGDFLIAASVQYGFALPRTYAVGFSNGANIAASLLLTRADAIAGAVLLRAMVPFEPSSPPDLTGRGVLLSQGRSDPLVSPEQTARLAELFGRAGASVELVWQAGGHALAQGDVTAAKRWLEGRVADATTPA
jgi:phospholipase/carboxylesterase